MIMIIMGDITFLLLYVKSPTSDKLKGEKSRECKMRSYANYVSLYYLRNEYPQIFGNNPDGYFFLGRQSLTIFAKKNLKTKEKKN